MAPRHRPHLGKIVRRDRAQRVNRMHAVFARLWRWGKELVGPRIDLRLAWQVDSEVMGDAAPSSLIKDAGYKHRQRGRHAWVGADLGDDERIFVVLGDDI